MSDSARGEGPPPDWNVVVTCHPYGTRDAICELRDLGVVARAHYPNVLVMRVDHPQRFVETPRGAAYRCGPARSPG